eukprot:SAG22_NODE_837_length_6911_cov_4.576629_10_plen_60_part_00
MCFAAWRSQGLHQEVFYLPQKPYQVLGTLVDQITYPETAADKSVSPAELREILGGSAFR